MKKKVLRAQMDEMAADIADLLDQVDVLEDELGEAEFRVLVTKADAFDLLVARG
jgi:hypothetical protein